MAVTNLEAAAIGTYDQWGLGGGANKIVAVNLPDDDDVTYIDEPTDGHREYYTFTSLPAEALSVTQVDLVNRARRTNAGETFATRCLLGVNDNVLTNYTPAAVYADNTDASIARPGGGIWSVDDVNSVEFGVRKSNALGGRVRVTTLYAPIIYVAAAGGLFTFGMQYILPVIGSLIGTCLSEADFKSITSYMNRLGKARIINTYPDEEEIKQFLTRYRFASYGV